MFKLFTAFLLLQKGDAKNVECSKVTKDVLTAAMVVKLITVHVNVLLSVVSANNCLCC